MTLTDNNGNSILINSIKPAAEYSLLDIEYLLNLASNQYEYDSIIDRLYFYNDNSKQHRKNRQKYSVLTARDLKNRSKKEVSYIDELGKND